MSSRVGEAIRNRAPSTWPQKPLSDSETKRTHFELEGGRVAPTASGGDPDVGGMLDVCSSRIKRF
jgi:hypothetical protein